MKNLVKVDIVALRQTQAGCAVFLGTASKVMVLYIDPAIGESINNELLGRQAPRPMTHDLFVSALNGFGVTISQIVITRAESDVFFAQMTMVAENEIMEKKIVQLDARPSDCIALAVRGKLPIYFYKELWDRLEGKNDLLEKLDNSFPNSSSSGSSPEIS